MRVKLRWIYQAEYQLGLIKTPGNSLGIIPEDAEMTAPIAWRKLALPRALSTSGIILGFYVLLFFLDIGVVIRFAALS